MNYNSIISSINRPLSRNDGDYLGADGLIYCGKCNTAKQMRSADRILTCLCVCEKNERDKEEAKRQCEHIEALRKMCLPLDRYRKSTFANADSNVKHITCAKNYVAHWEKFSDENIGLMFWGNTGTGKSYAALCIANALIDKDIPIKFISSASIVSTKLENRANLLNEVCNVPLLIIDDIGAERDTEYSRELLWDVIDNRRESNKPIIVTTNYTLEEIKNTTDIRLQRIFSRLSDCVPICVSGIDRRREIGKDKLAKASKILTGD